MMREAKLLDKYSVELLLLQVEKLRKITLEDGQIFVTEMGTIAFPSDGGRAHCIIEFIYYEVHVLCETHHDDNSYNFLKLTVR
jgi:hypothetical protein